MDLILIPDADPGPKLAAEYPGRGRC